MNIIETCLRELVKYQSTIIGYNEDTGCDIQCNKSLRIRIQHAQEMIESGNHYLYPEIVVDAVSMLQKRYDAQYVLFPDSLPVQFRRAI